MTMIIPVIASPAFQDRASHGHRGITDALVQAMPDAAGRSGQTLAANIKLSYCLVA
jgi:hypothetical protein